MSVNGDVTDGGGVEARAREDEWLVVRCQLGEREAFDELIQRWHEPLWKYVRRLAGHDDTARDLAQDIWVRVLRGIPRLRDGSKLRAWLFGIARRALMDRLRAQYAAPMAADVDVLEVAAMAAVTAEDTAGTLALEEESEALEDALAGLPVSEREVLTLFYLQELSLADVADVLNVPVGTVKSRLFRARRSLRRAMEAKGHFV
jgi:RNA polymerase sigma factor (sigma-70 family)